MYKCILCEAIRRDEITKTCAINLDFFKIAYLRKQHPGGVRFECNHALN